MKYIIIVGVLAVAVAQALVVGVKGRGQAEVNGAIPIPPPESIYGQVSYQESIALPSQALLNVDLLDITEMDAARRSVAQAVVKIEGHNPISFTLPVIGADLKTDHIYALQARISVGDVLWFSHAQPLPINRARESYLIHLEPVDPFLSSTKLSLKGHEWLAEWIEGNATIDPSPSLVIEDMNEEEAKAEEKHASPAYSTRYKVAGTGSCNRYFSTALLDEEQQKLQFSVLGMTFMACVDAVMHQEVRFVDMMPRVRSYQLDESTGRLYLIDAENEIIARFSAKFGALQ